MIKPPAQQQKFPDGRSRLNVGAKITPELLERLRVSAGLANRSISYEIAWRLEKSFEDEQLRNLGKS